MALISTQNLSQLYLQDTQIILPAFPNWKKSFISGPNSPLFEIEHRIETADTYCLISRVKFKDHSEGPPGHVHGGASAALIDEAMGIVVWHNRFLCVTQALNLKYLKTLPLTLDAYVVTEITTVTGRTIDVTCRILDGNQKSYVSAEGVFHRLTPEQLKKLADFK
jgi:acyl-coenzyme A thioesterase PaaI-like protein